MLIVLAETKGTDPEPLVEFISWKGIPQMRRRLGLRILLLTYLACSLVLAAAASAAPASPTLIKPFDDIAVFAGSTTIGAEDVATHFSSSGSEPLTFTVVAAPGAIAVEPGTLVVRISGTMLDVVASSTTWRGVGEFQVEACVGSGIDTACSLSNTFLVRVDPPPFGQNLNPAGYQILLFSDLTQSGAGESAHVGLELAPGAVLETAPRWYVDNVFVQEGTEADIGGLAPGPHLVEVRFEDATGPVTLRQSFSTRLPPTAAPESAIRISAAVVAGGALGAALVVGGSARLRRPLLLFVFSSVYSRLNKDSLLDHFNRGALHQVIKENPGIHFTELRRRTGISHGSAIHHLRALESGGYVRVVASGAFTHYYSTGQAMDEETYGLSPADNAVLAAVIDQPGISLGDLSSRLDRSLGNTSRAVSRLTSLGYVTTQREHRKRLVYPRPGSKAASQLLDGPSEKTSV